MGHDSITPVSTWYWWWKHNVKEIPTERKGRPPTNWLNQRPTFLRLVPWLDIGASEIYEEKPEGFHRGPVAVHPVWRENLFILSTALVPCAIQMAWYFAFPESKWNAFAAFAIYTISFVHFGAAALRRMHYYQIAYGTLDEDKRARDIVGDSRIDRLGVAVYAFIILRVAGVFVLGWDKEEFPMFDIWTLPKVALWDIALDYYFYAYHRSCHEVDWLWFIHRQHHSTRHPTPVLSILADDIQETLEVAILPLLACWTVPLRFHEQWLACCYLFYVEMMGHSGIRAYWPHPLVGHILRPFDMDLTIEDHDLHHRFGKSGRNYGKQTRIFDKIFGTITERVEKDTPAPTVIPGPI